MSHDPDLSSDDVREPPAGFLFTLKNIGPGIVVSGSVIGAGELLVTTSVGAEFGFFFLWWVITCTLIKYYIQVELGRYCLVNNVTSIEALNRIPGPKWRGTSWFVLFFFVARLLVTPAHVGILGSVAGLLYTLSPSLDARIWGGIVIVGLLLSLFRGYYEDVEKLVTFMVGGFSLAVVVSLFLIQGTDFAVTPESIAAGFSFRIPSEGWLVAIALMGSVGVNAWELFMYPYWVLEKGYPRFIGPRDGRDEEGWVRRANGWSRVLRADAIICTLLATLITLSYYLMGAAILHSLNIQPEGMEVVKSISNIFTEIYGPWAYVVFMFGAFCTLFSTLYVVCAAYGRVWTDLLKSLGLATLNSERERLRWYRFFQTVFPLVWLAFLMGVHRPLKLMILGLSVNGLMLPFLAVLTVYLAKTVPGRVRMSSASSVMLHLTTAVIVILTVMNLATSFIK